MALDVTHRLFPDVRGLFLHGRRATHGLLNVAACLLAALAPLTAKPIAAAPQQQTGGNDIPKTFTAPAADADYVKRDVMVPMRDGVKLHTVVVVPKGAR